MIDQIQTGCIKGAYPIVTRPRLETLFSDSIYRPSFEMNGSLAINSLQFVCGMQ